MQSHHALDMIFHILWEKKLLQRDSLGCKIFRTILFHQSLGGTKESNSYKIAMLTKQELVKFLDEPVFKYIVLLQNAVHQATLFGQPLDVKKKERAELFATSDFMIKQWK